MLKTQPKLVWFFLEFSSELDCYAFPSLKKWVTYTFIWHIFQTSLKFQSIDDATV